MFPCPQQTAILSVYYDSFNSVFGAGEHGLLCGWDYNSGVLFQKQGTDGSNLGATVLVGGVKDQFLYTSDQKDKMIKLWQYV